MVSKGKQVFIFYVWFACAAVAVRNEVGIDEYSHAAELPVALLHHRSVYCALFLYLGGKFIAEIYSPVVSGNDGRKRFLTITCLCDWLALTEY